MITTMPTSSAYVYLSYIYNDSRLIWHFGPPLVMNSFILEQLHDLLARSRALLVLKTEQGLYVLSSGSRKATGMAPARVAKH